MSKWIFGLLVGFAVVVPLLCDPGTANFSSSLLAPSSQHWCGTDHFGFDLCVRTAASLRTSLLVGALSAGLSTLIGTALGLAAGTSGGLLDRILMRLADATSAVPHLILSVVIVALFRGSLLAMIVAIAVTHWTTVARVVRSAVLSVRTSDYVAVSYSAGASTWWVLRQHLAPAAAGQVAVSLVMVAPHAVWHESALSFLGLGMQPDDPSLGTLLDLARTDITTGAWWTLLFPGLALVATTLSGAWLIPRTRPAEPPADIPVQRGDLAVQHPSITVGGKTILRDMSLAVKPGTVHLLIGASGVGKSTLAWALLGLVPAGAQVSGTISRPERVGVMPQAFTPVRRIGPQLAEVCGTEQVAALLQRVELGEGVAKLYPHQLSGGMAQRAGLAGALAMGPTYLIADEPTSGLDPELGRTILARLRALADEGMGILLISHDVAEAAAIADEITVLEVPHD